MKPNKTTNFNTRRTKTGFNGAGKQRVIEPTKGCHSQTGDERWLVEDLLYLYIYYV